MDAILVSLEERFIQIKEHNAYFDFLYEISKLDLTDLKNLKESCENLKKYLSNCESKDINGSELYDELCVLKTLFSLELEYVTNPFETLNYIHKKT